MYKKCWACIAKKPSNNISRWKVAICVVHRICVSESRDRVIDMNEGKWRVLPSNFRLWGPHVREFLEHAIFSMNLVDITWEKPEVGDGKVDAQNWPSSQGSSVQSREKGGRLSSLLILTSKRSPFLPPSWKSSRSRVCLNKIA